MLTNEQVTFVTDKIKTYPVVKEALENKRQDLEQIKRYGAPSKDKSVTTWSGAGGTSGLDDRICREIAMRERLEKEIRKLEQEARRIERGLEAVKSKDNNGIIDILVIQGKTMTEAAEALGQHRNSIRKQRNALFKEFLKNYKKLC